MQALYLKLRAMDAFILATPIYFMGATAQTKMMIDRCQALWSIKYVLKQPVYDKGPQVRKGLLIAVGGTTFSTVFRPLQIISRSLFATLDVEHGNNLIYADVDEKGAIQEHPTALEDAFKAGISLAQP
jgi:multimeric flavodoxin WrbA